MTRIARIVSDELVSLVVSAEGGSLRAVKLPAAYPEIFELGVPGAPLYEIQETDPDERMALRVLPNGMRLTESAHERASVDEPLLSWMDSSRCVGASLIHRLPVGRYFLVRTPLRPRASPRLLLGNEWIDAASNMSSLLEARNPAAARTLRLGVDFSRDFHACVIGPTDQAPAMNQVLFGAVALAYGDPQALFFSFMAPVESVDDAEPSLLVVPVDGEWVIDGSSAGKDRLGFWTGRGVIQFIAHLGVNLLRSEHVAEFGRPGSYADRPRER